MITSKLESPRVGWMAFATGTASILATLLIILFFTVGGIFGTVNDIFNGVAGILSGVLVWMLFKNFHLHIPFSHRMICILSAIGSVVVVIGSILIIFDITGWLLAGWYTTAGNALIGIGVLTFNDFVDRTNMLPHNVVTLGLLAGAIMAVGILALPGIIMGIDAIESSTWFLNLGFLSYLGTYLLYPIWAIWLGKILLLK
jgi:hypothetical protein